MQRNTRHLILMLAVMSSAWLAVRGISAVPPDGSAEASNTDGTATLTAGPATLEEARSRARLLHEMVHATLQIVHRQYYREDEALPLPASSLKSVFDELDRRQHVTLRWLAVDGQAMHTDHKPRDEFEKNAAKALASGKEEYEQVDDGVYRHAGAITLSSECLKCHVPDRTSLEDRTAGLVISMPISAGPPARE